jgi:hypothetical protein
MPEREEGRLLAEDVGYWPVQAIPGVGPMLGGGAGGRGRRRSSLPGGRQAVLLGRADAPPLRV